jgi:hypothetical protein
MSSGMSHYLAGDQICFHVWVISRQEIRYVFLYGLLVSR